MDILEVYIIYHTTTINTYSVIRTISLPIHLWIFTFTLTCKDSIDVHHEKVYHEKSSVLYITALSMPQFFSLSGTIHKRLSAWNENCQIPSKRFKRSPRCNWLPNDGTDDPKTLAHFCWTWGQFSCLTSRRLFGCIFFFFLNLGFHWDISFILFQNPRQTSQTTPIYLGWECLNSQRRRRPSALDNAELHHAVSNVSRLKRQFGAVLLSDTNTEQYAAPRLSVCKGHGLMRHNLKLP